MPLPPETKQQEDMRRELEQDGHRRFGARVATHVHRDENNHPAPEGELQNSIPPHPWLADVQRFDGIDPNLSPEPPLNSEARREMDNELRLQHQKKMEKQNAPSISATPKPRPN